MAVLESVSGWRLFALVTIPMSLVMLHAMTGTSSTSPEALSSLLQLSVRLSVPWLYLAFAASSLHLLFGRDFTRWLLVNRRILGLCFAAGMAWQLTFILWIVVGHFDHYAEEVYAAADLIVQLPGYAFLFAMTLTSFRPLRRRLAPAQWRALHKTGIYFLWGVVWSTYWYELYYYDDIQFIDYAYYWLGFLAFGSRVAAWVHARWQPAIA